MSVIYLPVTIDSAEEAEQMPIGTVAIWPGEQSAALRVDYGCGWHIAAEEMTDDHARMRGWTALIPTEVDESYRRGGSYPHGAYVYTAEIEEDA